MKKLLIVIGILLVAGGLWYTLSPLFITIEVDDELPTFTEEVSSGFEKLSKEQQEEMLQIMEELNVGDVETMDEQLPEPEKEPTTSSPVISRNFFKTVLSMAGLPLLL